MSDGGTVIRVPAEGIKRSGRSTQGVIVMRLRGDERVSTLARVVEQTSDAAELAEEDQGAATLIEGPTDSGPALDDEA